MTDAEQLREQMMRWGAERDEARGELVESESRIARLEAENGRMRASLRAIYNRAWLALGSPRDEENA